MRLRRLSAAVAAASATCVVMSGAGLASPSVAVSGHAPEEPLSLTVNDSASPMNVEGAPRFGWLPQDQDPNETQSAYQIRVSNAEGGLVWDSGRVRSGNQAYVEYDGPALASGEDYTWTVRTWDRTDRPSPWAKAATFETGIEDHEWDDAKWIQRPPGAPGPMTIVDGRARVNGGNVTLARQGGEWTDYTFKFTVRALDRAAGWVFRSPDRRNGYMWQLAPGAGLKTHSQVDGSYLDRDTVPLDVDLGREYRVRMDVEGSTIHTFVDGELVDERTNTRFGHGTVGFRQASGEVAEFDDIVVTGPDGQTLLADDFSNGLGNWANESTERQADEWTLARKVVDLTGEEVVRARAYVAGSHTYELRINGERADRGQSFSYPDEGYYQASDVTSLVSGQNDVAVGAVLHWAGSGQNRPAGVPGLLVRITIEYADGSTQTVVSDGSWKVTEGPYLQAGRRNGEGGRIEHLSGPRKHALAGWDKVGYDDSVWDDAVVLGTHPVEPFTHLTGQETRIVETRVQAERLLIADDGTVVADFGKIIPARPAVHFDDGAEGRVVHMRTGYDLTDDGRVATSELASQGTDMSYPYSQMDGPQNYQAFTHLAFRYLEIPGAGEDIAVEDVTAVVVHTDVPERTEAKFDSSNETLDAVWNLVQRSALLSIQQQFVDTPTREKAQFLGDAANISYATMQGYKERDATQQAIQEFLQSQERYWNSGDDAGRYNAVYPNGDGKRDIPDYTEMFVNWVWRYYQVTGDQELLERAYPSIRATAEYVLRHIPESGPTAGLVTNLSGGSGAYRYGIVDWPAPGRFGYDMDTAARTTINALGVEVLRRTADMAQVLDRPAAEGRTYRQAQSNLVDNMNGKLRRADGVYIDGLYADGTQSDHAGQHSTSYAIAFGIAPEDDLPQLADHLAGMGMKQGPMTAHWLLKALSDAERPEAVLDLLTNRDDLGWADIVLNHGATFTWEAWTLVPGTNFSQSHGWGSQAAVDIMQTMLGIRLGEPGAETVRIYPPAGGLQHAKGTVHTQRGPVSLEWRRNDHGLITELTVPVNVVAQVKLPQRDGWTYRAVGPTKARYVGTEGGRVVFEAGSGRSRFVPVPERAGD